MARPNPTLRRRQLAAKLKELRLARGLTLDEVGERLMVSAGKLSRLENAQRGIMLRDVRDLCAIYDVSASETESLMSLAREARQPGLRQQLGDLGDQAAYPYVELEASASKITEFQCCFLPGLLQTPDYARALIRGMLPHIQEHVLNSRVEARMKRRELLRQEEPPQYWTLIDEAALHRVVGSPEVMGEQLRGIIKTAELPNIVVQVIPFSVGAYMGLDNSFAFLEIPDPQTSAVVFIEGLETMEYLEKPSDLKPYREALGHLHAAALHPRESVELVKKISRERFPI
ncbi:helix-turn-helix domain-containing protein [Microbispora sp. NPDC049125]|uniref:helix-turn-helix domain-containing protein n=1 Tax=Microbispora sp. NPDC049125 TaxID=3154929 RepID=UPI003465EFA4